MAEEFGVIQIASMTLSHGKTKPMSPMLLLSNRPLRSLPSGPIMGRRHREQGSFAVNVLFPGHTAKWIYCKSALVKPACRMTAFCVPIGRIRFPWTGTEIGREAPGRLKT
jgi:hypothetical protein